MSRRRERWNRLYCILNRLSLLGTIPRVRRLLYEYMIQETTIQCICGGWDQTLNQYQKSIVLYDWSINEMIARLPDMKYPRTTPSISIDSIRRCVYVCGGYDGSNYQRSCEMYDVQSRRWTEIPDMPVRDDSLRSRDRNLQRENEEMMRLRW